MHLGRTTGKRRHGEKQSVSPIARRSRGALSHDAALRVAASTLPGGLAVQLATNRSSSSRLKKTRLPMRVGCKKPRHTWSFNVLRDRPPRYFWAAGKSKSAWSGAGELCCCAVISVLRG